MFIEGRVLAALLCSCVLISAAGCAAARVAPTTRPVPATDSAGWRLELTTSTLPKYLGSNGAVFHDAGVQHSSATVRHERSGAYGKVFMSLPLGERGAAPNYGRETDVGAGWDGTVRQFSVHAEANYIDVSPAWQHRGNAMLLSSTTSLNVPIRTGLTLTPYSSLKLLFPVSGAFPEGGWFLHNGANYGWSPPAGPTVAGFAEVVYDSGAFGFETGLLTRAQASLNWSLSPSLTLQAPVVQFSAPLSRLTDGRHTQILVSGGVVASW